VAEKESQWRNSPEASLVVGEPPAILDFRQANMTPAINGPCSTQRSLRKPDLASWSFTVEGLVDRQTTWSWDEIHALPPSAYSGDIHCVTTWSKLGVNFEGVSVDTLLNLAGVDPKASHVLAFCSTGYTTNLPLVDITGGQAWVVWEYETAPFPIEHGGPAHLLVPYLYFWKSAK
jgi:DMSO/TMAO reductase YedYZ molybdopterin-dependent catalytic subunit